MTICQPAHTPAALLLSCSFDLRPAAPPTPPAPVIIDKNHNSKNSNNDIIIIIIHLITATSQQSFRPSVVGTPAGYNQESKKLIG